MYVEKKNLRSHGEVVRVVFESENDLEYYIWSVTRLIDFLDKEIYKQEIENMQTILSFLKDRVVRDYGINEGLPTLTLWPSLSIEVVFSFLALLPVTSDALLFEKTYDKALDLLPASKELLDVRKFISKETKKYFKEAKDILSKEPDPSPQAEVVDIPDDIKEKVVISHRQGYLPYLTARKYNLSDDIYWKILDEKGVKYSTKVFTLKARGVDIDMMNREIVRLYNTDLYTNQQIIDNFVLSDKKIIYDALKALGVPTRDRRGK